MFQLMNNNNNLKSTFFLKKKKSILILNCYSNYKFWCSVNFFPWHYYESHFPTKSRINNSNIFCFNYEDLMGHNETMLSGAEKII